MIVAMIPARGGSKRIPRKNIKLFHGKPIIAYSIEAALSSGLFDEVIVSTDDKEIAEVAERYGAKVPFMRPDNIADDYATTVDVIKHTLSWYADQAVDVSEICCIYATAPLIKVADLTEAYHLLIHESLDYVFSATEYSFPIQRAFKINKDGLCEMFEPAHLKSRSQDLTKAYHDAGQFYFGKASAFLADKNVFNGADSKPHLLPSYRVQDIDTLADWTRAELISSTLHQEEIEPKGG